jgi:hypothetical protein
MHVDMYSRCIESSMYTCVCIDRSQTAFAFDSIQCRMPSVSGLGLEALKKIIESLSKSSSSELLRSVDKNLLLRVAKRLLDEIAERRSKL